MTEMRIRAAPPIDPGFFSALRVDCYRKYLVANNSYSNVHFLRNVPLEDNGTYPYRVSVMLGQLVYTRCEYYGFSISLFDKSLLHWFSN